MYAGWPFFRMLIDNLEMTLAKSSLEIAAEYLDLVPDGEQYARDRIWSVIHEEHDRTVHAVLNIVESEELLERHPMLRRSIALRNPYVDPMNAIQVGLLQHYRSETGASRAQTGRILARSIAGVASALRNTG